MSICTHTTETARRGSLTRCTKPVSERGLCRAHLAADRRRLLNQASYITRRQLEGETVEELLWSCPNNPHRRDLIAAVCEVGDGPEVLDVYYARRDSDPAQVLGSGGLYMLDGVTIVPSKRRGA